MMGNLHSGHRSFFFSVSWPESYPVDEIRQGWVTVVTVKRVSECIPSPLCSLSQTGPNVPNSWAEPGIDTGSR